MDDFLSQILSSSSWPDMNATGRSSWGVSSADQTNGLLDNPMGLYVEDEKNQPVTVIPSSQTVESLTTRGLARCGQDNTSVLIGGNSNYDLDSGLLHGENQPQQDASDCASIPLNNDSESNESRLPLQRGPESCLAAKPLPNNSSKFLPVVGCSANSSLLMPGADSVGSDGNESSGFQQSLRDSHSISSISPLWPTSYAGIPSLSPLMGQSKIYTYGLQGEFLESNGNLMGKRYPGDEKLLQLDNLPVVLLNEKEELHGSNLPSFTAGPQMALTKAAGLQPHQQSVPATTIGCNGTAKPRVRARRGQATDPHSIAERLRREKIAERMKNLQELVPNSNKTDKASMLDEIIDYVKFLQLQVKVLSMSRLGAAGAVVPLITDFQAEGSSNLHLSASVGQGAELSESEDNIAFEQEVVKLMESNVTMAMQFLQNKGLCLMPIALAAAISGTKTSSNSAASEKKNPSMVHVNGSCPLGPGTQPLPPRSDSLKTENTNGCNGSVKQEEVHNSVGNIRELKPESMND